MLSAVISQKPALACAAILAALALAPGAFAQNTSQKSDAPVVDVVIVTATKREVDVQKLPEAVTAITDVQLDDLNAQTFEDYFRTVPGLQMNSTGSGLNRFDFSLRGISSFNLNSPPTSATVGQYFDEIPVTAVGQQIDPRLVDVERIEVLRGPQGTYFGEDSLGGTIRIITKKPNLGLASASVEGRISETAHGATNDSESVMVNVPLIEDKLAVRANYFNSIDSGYIDNVTGACTDTACNVTGVKAKGINPDRGSGGRAMVLFQAMDRLSILAEVIHSDSKATNTASYAPKVGDLKTIQKAPDSDVKDQNNLYNLTGNVDLGAVDLVSSSSWGYRSFDNQTPAADLMTGALTQAGVMTAIDTYAQEVRLVSAKDASSRWDYIVGGYFSRQATRASSYGPAQFGNFIREDISKEKAGFGELGYQFTEQLIARLGVRHQTVDFVNNFVNGAVTSSTSGSNSPTTGRAVVNYDFTHDAMVYSSISKGFRKGGLNSTLNPYNPAQPIPGIPQVYGPDTTTNYEMGWKLTFPSSRATLNGALYHIDWKDIQVQGTVPVPGGPASAFQQFNRNAGAAKVDGLELEGGMELLRGLQTQASFALMNPVITQDQPLTADSPGFFAGSYCGRGCPARRGDRIPFVPKVSGSFTLSYRHALGMGGFTGLAVLSEQYLGRRNTDFAPTWTGPSQPDSPCGGGGFGGGPSGPCPRTHTGDPNLAFRTMPGSVRTNLQVGIEDKHWRATIFADNVFNRHTPLLIVPAIPGTDQDHLGDISLTSRPRTIGLWVRRTID